MSAYSKLIASVIGSVVAMVLVYLAGKGIATCTAAPDGTQACTIFGIADTQVTAAAVALISAVFVWLGPKNTA